jgi:hypothetical protein
METVEQIAADMREQSSRIGDEYMIATGMIRTYAGDQVELGAAARLRYIRDVLAGLDLALEQAKAAR